MVGCIRHLHRLLGGGLGRMLPLDGNQVHQQQHYDHRKDGSEVEIKFLADRHCCSSVKTPILLIITGLPA